MIVCVTFSKFHRSAMKVKSVASKSCYKGTTLSKSTGHPVQMKAYLTIQCKKKKKLKEEKTKRSLCVHQILNEIYNHSVHKEFGKYIFCLLYTAII